MVLRDCVPLTIRGRPLAAVQVHKAQRAAITVPASKHDGAFKVVNHVPIGRGAHCEAGRQEVIEVRLRAQLRQVGGDEVPRARLRADSCKPLLGALVRQTCQA